MSTETTVSNLKINKLTKAQFDTITPSATEAYELTDLSSILDGKQDTLTSANAGNCIEIIRSSLPSDYTQLEYIETSGTQYINTGVAPSVAKETEIRLTIARTTSASLEGFGSNSNLNCAIATPDLWRINGVQTQIPIVNNEFITLIFKQTSNGRYYKIGTTEGYGSANAVNNSFCLGQLAGGSGYVFKGKHKSCTILENGVAILNLVPARRKSDLVLGMYDTVSNTFLTNSGTGTFIAGEEAFSNTQIINFTNDAGYITSSALSGYQTTSNLVTSVSASSTDAQYPSAKLFYDTVGNIESALNAINSGSNS